MSGSRKRPSFNDTSFVKKERKGRDDSNSGSDRRRKEDKESTRSTSFSGDRKSSGRGFSSGSRDKKPYRSSEERPRRDSKRSFGSDGSSSERKTYSRDGADPRKSRTGERSGPRTERNKWSADKPSFDRKPGSRKRNEEGDSRKPRYGDERPRRDDRQGSRSSGYGRDRKPAGDRKFNSDDREKRSFTWETEGESGSKSSTSSPRESRKREDGGFERKSRTSSGSFSSREKRKDSSDFSKSGEKRKDSSDYSRSSERRKPKSDIITRDFEDPKSRLRPRTIEIDTENREIRLNRFLALAGIASRRDADKLIESGLVKINGELVTELGTKVKPTDHVTYNDSVIRPEKKVYILLNKPKDYITTTDDPNERKTVMDLVKEACKERLFPIGRLDRNTTGVLLMTNDGDFAEKVSHPRYGIKKVYVATLDKNYSQSDRRNMEEGLELEDGPIKPDFVDYIKEDDRKTVMVEIHSGRNHIIHRMFELQGYKVVKLDRVAFGNLAKTGLKRGEFRFLEPREVQLLTRGRGKSQD